MTKLTFETRNLFEINTDADNALCSQHKFIDTSAVVNKPFSVSLFIMAVIGDMEHIILDKSSNFNNHEACVKDLLQILLDVPNSVCKRLFRAKNYAKPFIAR
jgi:hypothetical protein